MNTFYYRFRHRIMTKWTQLHQCYGGDISSDACAVTGNVNIDDTCDSIRDFIYTILLHLRTQLRQGVYDLTR